MPQNVLRFAEPWYPVLVSGATIAAVMLGTQRSSGGQPRNNFAKGDNHRLASFSAPDIGK